MSELTREKIYKKELIAGGAEGNNNLERIRSLAGGGASKKSFFIEELDVKLPEKLRFIQACGNGDYIYLCGGIDNEGYGVANIYKFNTKTKEIDLVENSLVEGMLASTLVYAYGKIWLFGGYQTGGIQNQYVYRIDTETFDTASVNSTPVNLGNKPLVTHRGNAFYIFTYNKMYRLVVDETNLVGGELEEIKELDNYKIENGAIFETDESDYSIFTVGGGAGIENDKHKNNWGIKLDENGTPTLEMVGNDTLNIASAYPYQIAYGKQNEKYVIVDFTHKSYYSYKYDKTQSRTIVSEAIPLESSNSNIKGEVPTLQNFATVSTPNGIYLIGGAVSYGDNVDTIYKITLN